MQNAPLEHSAILMPCIMRYSVLTTILVFFLSGRLRQVLLSFEPGSCSSREPHSINCFITNMHSLLYSEKINEEYKDSVTSLTLKIIKLRLIMHAFHGFRYIYNQNGCLVSVTLHWFKYSTNPNGTVQPSILKSHKRSKMNETHFYHLYSLVL